MKKFISIAVASALISTSLMASTVNGNVAVNLRSALIKAGAEVKVMTDASFLNVSSVKCGQEGGIVLLPLKCEFVDKSSGRLEEVNGDKAEALAKALEAAGIKSVSTRSGELTTLKITAKSIDCSTMAIPQMVSCEIKK